MSENGYVGLVLVSHSASLAQGVAELVSQVAGSEVAIAAVGGGPGEGLGVDGARVLEQCAAGLAAPGRCHLWISAAASWP